MDHYPAMPCCGEREATSARQLVDVVSTYSEISIVTIPMERRWCVGGFARFTGRDLLAFYLIQSSRQTQQSEDSTHASTTAEVRDASQLRIVKTVRCALCSLKRCVP
ncbi:hypothetical protein E2C01_073473 [Portunus trituberculatus]|uniref:Uncharacterized protein n=1 Tax=Portunus trituberculatus TaxID=210409 RepID=A0A5B7I9I8_PORTR|nr:hypothetical protein [Portunus trituberculatus]